MDEIYLSVYELSPSVHDNHRDGWDVYPTVDEIYSQKVTEFYSRVDKIKLSLDYCL